VTRHVLDSRIRVLGADHPHTLDTRYLLAWILGYRDKQSEAAAESRRALQARLRVLGANHPDTVASQQQVHMFYRPHAMPEQDRSRAAD
jgi:hypothetical protein